MYLTSCRLEGWPGMNDGEGEASALQQALQQRPVMLQLLAGHLVLAARLCQLGFGPHDIDPRIVVAPSQPVRMRVGE